MGRGANPALFECCILFLATLLEQKKKFFYSILRIKKTPLQVNMLKKKPVKIVVKTAARGGLHDRASLPYECACGS